MAFQITDEFIEQVQQLIDQNNDAELHSLLTDFHFADIAEILDELETLQATYLLKLLNSETTSDALMELDENVRERLLENLSPKEIAEEVQEMDTDDAADVMAELDDDIQQEVIDEIQDQKHAQEIQELLNYEEDSAGGLMAKELVRVKETWTIAGCVREMRRQAKNVTRVHSIYVTDRNDILMGRLSLKDLLTAPEKAHISDIYIPKVDFVHVDTPGDEVARIMQKYDLEALPVVDDNGVLVGRVTVDDIMDFIKDEAEKDYQLAAGITQEVEADDTIFELTKARLPWLVLGLFGGLASVFILQDFESFMNDPQVKALFFFTPLIAAMAGNVGVQSSAIIVQGLANDVVKGSLLSRLLKEVGLSLINGSALGILVIIFGAVMGYTMAFSITIAISMLSVIIIAALIGTFVPIILDKKGIDPAIATGPFITTSNDIFGIFLFFYLSKLILQF